MKKTWVSIAAVGAALLALAGANAGAQLSDKGGPIAYSADNLEYRDNDRQLFLTGNVDVQQDDSRIQSDRLTIYFKASSPSADGKASGSNDIDHIVAEGNVVYVRTKQKAKGDRAVYDTASDSVTFTGNVVVATDENVIRGETLVLEIGAGRTTVRPPAGGPGQGVLQSTRSAEKGKQPAATAAAPK